MFSYALPRVLLQQLCAQQVEQLLAAAVEQGSNESCIAELRKMFAADTTG